MGNFFVLSKTKIFYCRMSCGKKLEFQRYITRQANNKAELSIYYNLSRDKFRLVYISLWVNLWENTTCHISVDTSGILMQLPQTIGSVWPTIYAWLLSFQLKFVLCLWFRRCFFPVDYDSGLSIIICLIFFIAIQNLTGLACICGTSLWYFNYFIHFRSEDPVFMFFHSIHNNIKYQIIFCSKVTLHVNNNKIYKQL